MSNLLKSKLPCYEQGCAKHYRDLDTQVLQPLQSHQMNNPHIVQDTCSAQLHLELLVAPCPIDIERLGRRPK